jgi:fumarate hydratase class I
MKSLTIPISKEIVRSLKVGEAVSLNGRIYTGRDAVHKYLFKGGALPKECNWKDGVLYHCGPVMLKDGDGYRCTAAGPTTSSREEPYQWKIIADYGLSAVIGKGGMGEKMTKACQEYGCVYLHAIGGAAQVYAEAIKKVHNVYMLEQFGSPEAIWELEVENFVATVTIDANGNSLHRDIFEKSSKELSKYL